ncbi:hypothetical protein [Janthinobacterium sp. P210006]|uniref:cyanobactin maturation protease PatG family protein n=1 Tax=Janthinobacterium sp. P210006 TaxID=3112939 RepID=UPI002E25BD98|nr:hypothetical protein [Janthinobacterium sp. P210006]
MMNDEQGTPDDSAGMDAPMAGHDLVAQAPTPAIAEVTPMLALSTDASNQGGIAAPAAPGWQASDKSLIYAFGKIGYDFGTQARMDSIFQLMEPDHSPFNTEQLLDFLAKREAETRMLIWTLNVDLTPVYALEPGEPCSRDTYALLIGALEGQVRGEGDAGYIARVAIPGYLTGKKVRLYSGQVVPVVSVPARAIYYCDVNQIIEDAVKAVGANQAAEQVDKLRIGLRECLNRIYCSVCNLGMWSSDRATNFVAINAAQTVTALTHDLLAGSSGGIWQLAQIAVEKSPVCRVDSDCWDVKLAFFDPENHRRPMRIVCYTIDVSNVMPVTIGEPKSWEANMF